jgi:hypothetical protein
MFFRNAIQRRTKQAIHYFGIGAEHGAKSEQARILEICDNISCTNKIGEYVYLDDLKEYLDNPELGTR